MRKKVVSAILCASMVAGMVVIPGVAVKADDKKLIGVTMPTKDLQRWNQDGENMKKELEAAGYEVDLQYASNDVSTQVSQLENQVANGCDLLVVASIDGSSLGEPLKQAKEAGIPVISYDRLTKCCGVVGAKSYVKLCSVCIVGCQNVLHSFKCCLGIPCRCCNRIKISLSGNYI